MGAKPIVIPTTPHKVRSAMWRGAYKLTPSFVGPKALAYLQARAIIANPLRLQHDVPANIQALSLLPYLQPQQQTALLGLLAKQPILTVDWQASFAAFHQLGGRAEAMALYSQILTNNNPLGGTSFNSPFEVSPIGPHTVAGLAQHPALRLTAPGMPAIGFSYLGKRDNNEDAALFWQDAQGRKYYVLADGMGGHGNGEVASQETIRLIHEYLSSEAIAKQPLTPEILKKAIQYAHARLTTGLSTVTVAVMDGDQLHYIATGDSRMYLLKASGERVLLNPDMTLKAAGIAHDMGLPDFTDWVGLTGAQLAEYETKLLNDRTDVMGGIGVQIPQDYPIAFASGTLTMEPGDYLLATSDGLVDVFGNDIGAGMSTVVPGATTLEAAAEKINVFVDQFLATAANADNATYILAQYVPARVADPAAPAEATSVADFVVPSQKPELLLARKKISRLGKTALALGTIAAWGAGALGLTSLTWTTAAKFFPLAVSNAGVAVTTLLLWGAVLLVGGVAIALIIREVNNYRNTLRGAFDRSPVNFNNEFAGDRKDVARLTKNQQSYLAFLQAALPLLKGGDKAVIIAAYQGQALTLDMLIDLLESSDNREVRAQVLAAVAMLREANEISEGEEFVFTLKLVDEHNYRYSESGTLERLLPAAKALLASPIEAVRRQGRMALNILAFHLSEGSLLDLIKQLKSMGQKANLDQANKLERLRLFGRALKQIGTSQPRNETVEKLLKRGLSPKLLINFALRSNDPAIREGALSVLAAVRWASESVALIKQQLSPEVFVINVMSDSVLAEAYNRFAPVFGLEAIELVVPPAPPAEEGEEATEPVEEETIDGDDLIEADDDLGTDVEIPDRPAAVDMAPPSDELPSGALPATGIDVAPPLGAAPAAATAAGARPVAEPPAAAPGATAGAATVGAIDPVQAIFDSLQQAKEQLRTINERFEEDDEINPGILVTLLEEVDAIAQRITSLNTNIDALTDGKEKTRATQRAKGITIDANGLTLKINGRLSI